MRTSRQCDRLGRLLSINSVRYVGNQPALAPPAIGLACDYDETQFGGVIVDKHLDETVKRAVQLSRLSADRRALC